MRPPFWYRRRSWYERQERLIRRGSCFILLITLATLALALYVSFVQR